MKLFKYILYLSAISCTLVMACSSPPVETKPFIIPPASPSLLIEQRGMLKVYTDNNPTDYYLHKGAPRGFQYELIKSFSEYLGVKLHLESDGNYQHAIDSLHSGKYDISALGFPIHQQQDTSIIYSNPLFYTRWVLVQNQKQQPRIDSLHQLWGREIVVPPDSPAATYLKELSDSLNLFLNITEWKDKTPQELLLMVENREISFTVVEEHIAHVASQYMPHLDYSFPLSDELPVCWIMASNALGLQQEINRWLESIKKEKLFHIIYHRYYKSHPHTTLSEYCQSAPPAISAFDQLIRNAAQQISWDWRLLAALIYHESRFLPEVVSEKGAGGLMQVMPETADHFGIDNFMEPDNNIQAGTYFIKYLCNYFEEEPFAPTERDKFILAAYNAGPGHVRDAMRLATADQKSPYIWNQHVDYYLRHKSNPIYYRDTLVRHGYCNGRETYDFVNNIIETYTHYKNFISE